MEINVIKTIDNLPDKIKKDSLLIPYLYHIDKVCIKGRGKGKGSIEKEEEEESKILFDDFDLLFCQILRETWW